MPQPTFRGDPYRELDLSPDASGATIKRRWRELARQHHPDRAAGDREEADRLTGRMARINAAYDLLRDPIRRARFDQSPAGHRAREQARAWGAPGSLFEDEEREAHYGPPPPPLTRPVTARFDTTAAFRPRNTTLSGRPVGFGSAGPPFAGGGARVGPPVRHEEPDLRASTPSGPVERQRAARPAPAPTLREARETVLAFGKHRGYTLGEVELLEPTYIDWIAQTITRDRDLVIRARVIQGEMDRQGVTRRVRPTAPGFGDRTESG